MFDIKYWNYGDSYVVKLEDGRYVLADIENNLAFSQSLDILIQFGMWVDDPPKPSDDVMKAIGTVLKKDGFIE